MEKNSESKFKEREPGEDSEESAAGLAEEQDEAKSKPAASASIAERALRAFRKGAELSRGKKSKGGVILR